MTSYKGIKGPFGYDIDENNHGIDLVLPNETVISCSRDNRYTGKYVIERDEMNATMKLISKSTEMFEMLESIVAMFSKGQFLTEEKVIKKRTEIEQLIKEATTI